MVSAKIPYFFYIFSTAVEVVEHDVEAQPLVESDPHSIPESRQVELESGQTQEKLGATYETFSGFFSGLASAVEQRASL